MFKLSIRIYLVVLALSTGCGQVDQANSHLKEMDQTSKQMLQELALSRESLTQATAQSVRIADALVAIKDLSIDLTNLLKSMFKIKEPKKTDDIDAVI